ncbi:forkhead box protein B2-like isoform X2 [Schistocerca serialis cubense]|nr:forkhead box protein B2-like isoform X2 [Schistocerca serialis cubense]
MPHYMYHHQHQQGFINHHHQHAAPPGPPPAPPHPAMHHHHMAPLGGLGLAASSNGMIQWDIRNANSLQRDNTSWRAEYT